ncbi:MAG: histidine kinase N-terminal 7TM domain-containing protein [Haloarculaceae archaeon]
MSWLELSNAATLPFVSYVGAALIVAALLSVMGWRERDSVQAFQLLGVGLMGWTLTYAVRILVTDLALLTVLTELVFLWVSVVTVGWVLFAVTYVGHREWLTRRRVGALLAIQVAVLATVITTPLHHLFFTSASLETAGTVRVARLPFGPLGWLGSGIDYGFMFAGAALLVWFAVRSNRLYRWQTAAVLVGVVVPMATTVVHLLDLDPGPGIFDPSPIAFAVAAVPLGIAIHRFRFTRVLPVAQATVVRSLADGVVVVDDAGIIIDVNAAARSVLARTTDHSSWVGRRAADVLPPQFVEHGLEGATDADGAECELRVDGEQRWYWLRALPVEGGAGGRVLTFADVTDQKRYERELERQIERLDQFAGVVSHDLRNPINVIDGQASLLDNELDDATARDRVNAIRDASDRMTELIDDVLTLAREGQPIDSPEPCDVDAVANSAWDHVATEGATLAVRTDGLVVEADASRLTQLFENLFRNALEHGSTGNQNAPRADDATEHVSPDVTVRVGALAGDERAAAGFFVEDDGPGIPPEERESVLAPGYSNAADGTGFGLGIVAEIADAHGWTRDVTDAADAPTGARFEFWTAPSGRE